MILITNHITTNQLEEGPQAYHAPHTPLLHPVFKNFSLRAIGEFGSFEHEVPILLTWPAASLHFPLSQLAVSGLALPSIQQATGPKFGSVTEG